VAFQLQQPRLGRQATGKSREFSGGSDNTVTRSNNGNGVSAIGSANRAHRRRAADLLGDLPVGASLAIRYGQQRIPNTALEFRPCEIELHGKRLALAGEILGELTLRLQQHRVGFVLHDIVQADSPGTIVLPEDSGQTNVARDQFEWTYGRLDHFAEVPCHVELSIQFQWARMLTIFGQCAGHFRTAKSADLHVRKRLSSTCGRSYTAVMTQDRKSLYAALTAHDSRFDGVFFVGVTSTGIYCRPICPVKTPKEVNCLFFDSAQEAEQAHFRPCLRCRPELAPGNAPVDDSQRIAQLIVQRLEDGTIGSDAGLEAIADQFELSSRQIRRIVQKELGVPPIQLLLTRRLLLAKQLLTETTLPVTEIAFASGFSSLRRFNDAFNSRYDLAPTHLRKKANEQSAGNDNKDTSTLQLAYRPPYDWDGILDFLANRQLKGVEWVTGSSYARTVHLGDARGWIRVTQPKKKNSLMMEFTHSLTPVLPALLTRVRDLFDLNARPDLISGQLSRDRRLAPLVKQTPGMRVPGAFNGFELGLRAIIGQQVTVKAATTLGCRFAEAFGEPIVTPFPELSRLTPAATRVAKASVDDIAKLGIVSMRSRSIIALAQAQVSGKMALDGGVHHKPDEAIRQIVELPGIGPWTAHYIAMRALRWPDAFPKEDIAIRNNLGGLSAKEAEEMSQAWRPWRSYAVMHIWRSLGGKAARPPTAA